MEYNRYVMTWKDNGKCACLSMLGVVFVTRLFYDNWIGLMLYPIVFGLCRKSIRKKYLKKQKTELCKQFQEAMQSVCTSLLAGVSIENAWKEAQSEIELLHGKSSYLAKELMQMNQYIDLRMPIEKVLQDFAKRSDIDDIISFAEVFSFAKRSGGNLIQIIENTVYHMQNKLEVEEEIQVLVASKKLEQRIMEVVPIIILGYLKTTSYDYIRALYANLVGFGLMTICLFLYLGAIFMAEKVLEIRV